MVEEIEMQDVRCGVAEVKSRRAVVEVEAQYAEAEAERVLVSDRSEAEVRAIASAAVQEGYVEYTSSGERLAGSMLGTKMGGERGKGLSERGVVVKECIVAAATSKELLTVIPVLFLVVLSLLVHLVYVVYPSPWCNAFDGVSSCGVAVGTLLSTGKILGFGNES
jgi:hypothetical protein